MKQESDKNSISFLRKLNMTLVMTLIHFFTVSYWGLGLTRKKLLKAQVDCFINCSLLVQANIVTNLSKAFSFIKLSLILVQSLAKFPKSQVA